MATRNHTKSEVKVWLKDALAKENLEDFSVKIIGSSEKGEGYVGEVLFVAVSGTTKEGLKKEYDLVLKCSKLNEALIEKTPALLKTFTRETYTYEKIFPVFKQFELERKIENPFDSVPKCYGVFSSETRYVVVLENLKKIGYDLWSNKKPLTREHIDLVVSQYAKFHAISVAMREKEPEKFRKIVDGIDGDIFKEVFQTSNFTSVYEGVVEELFHLLQGHLEEHTLKKWLTFKEQIRFISVEMAPATNDLQVLVHGDCWNNNFMYKYKDEDESAVSRVAILDWQITNLSSPVYDLSYFLFACISKQDISSMNDILKEYYDAFSDHLRKLGSEFTSNYSFEKLLEEWKKYSKYGIMACLLPIKLSYLDKKDTPDMAESAERGDDISKSFAVRIENLDYLNRVKPIIQHAVENGLI